MARVLGALGLTRALVVHGAGGLDELSLEPGNIGFLVTRGGEPHSVSVEAAGIGLAGVSNDALRGGDASENATMTRALLQGERGPRREAVVLNAAAALWTAERAASLEAGAKLAQETIDSGAASRTLARYIEVSRSLGED
jgi:anthranilate phosphoribosyltransferase